MAGAGYKLFNTGDVLTAAQVNTYLQEQVVMVFNDATARTTALSGVLAEGMVSYLKSTKVVEIYNGTAWASLDDPNAIQNTIVDAKGDLISASGNDVPARLAVGNNGETLVADSSTSTGLRWQGNFAAGKNKIINGDFAINQRAFSSTTTSGTYGFDRFQVASTDGTVTYSAQTFTVGTAPVAGYESINFARLVSSGQTLASARAILQQPIEDVRTFAGQTVTVSFWAKASTGTPSVAASITQSFGTGSPTSAVNTNIGKTAITTSWARYTMTVAVPSISGATIAANSSLILRLWISAGTDHNSATNNLGIQSATIDFWGIQLEAGSVATAFQTATGTLAGELSACRRYLPAISGSGSNLPGAVTSTTATVAFYSFDVPARVAPTGLTFSALSDFSVYNKSSSFANPTAIALNTGGVNNATIAFTTTAGSPTLAAGETAQIYSNGSGALILLTGCEL